jgi:hypothetical protein
VADFVKTNNDAPPGFFALEAAGLRWLAVDGGARCARVFAHDERSLTLEQALMAHRHATLQAISGPGWQ